MAKHYDACLALDADSDMLTPPARGDVHALVGRGRGVRAIEVGEEFAVSYLPPWLLETERNEERVRKLRDDFGFACVCARCN